MCVRVRVRVCVCASASVLVWVCACVCVWGGGGLCEGRDREEQDFVPVKWPPVSYIFIYQWYIHNKLCLCTFSLLCCSVIYIANAILFNYIYVSAINIEHLYLFHSIICLYYTFGGIKTNYYKQKSVCVFDLRENNKTEISFLFKV